ncbi:uncharacterized protein LOC133196053 [Saccostrea echinata]|uniref:uncharacterized protein LOC133196053 n=1 Tax=Saccostrea echinata TaxID=191078 RepID=UPI002A810AC6|nr:uncharacterized protein LOC133196053 [Saccostrea echinata]
MGGMYNPEALAQITTVTFSPRSPLVVNSSHAFQPYDLPCQHTPVNVFIQCPNSTADTRSIQSSLTTLDLKKDTVLKRTEKLKSQPSSMSGKKYFNAAYSKRASQSSTYGKDYSTLKAVNGALHDFSHSKAENHPWILIDLGKDFYVFEVEIYNVDKKVQCCANRFHDADIKAGRSLDSMLTCGHFVGPGKDKERIIIRCRKITVARYVKIQITSGTNNYLHIAEVLVWATEM